MPFRVEVTAMFETHEQAEDARAAMTEAVGKHDGEVDDDTITDEDEDAAYRAGLDRFGEWCHSGGHQPRNKW